MKLPQTLLLVVIATCSLLLAGCNEKSKAQVVDRVKVVTGANQTALPQQEYAKTLRIELEGPRKTNFLGGGGTRELIANRVVHFVPLDNSDIKITPATVTTDEGGSAQVTLQAGSSVGDHYIKIIPEGFEEKSTTIRLSSGINITGGDQEQKTGTIIKNPITVKMADAKGEPMVGVPVYFRMGKSPIKSKNSAKLVETQEVTNEKGEASTKLQLGKTSGEYTVEVEISDPNSGIFLRSKSIRQIAYNVTAILIAVLGGLTIFVFGMKLMGDGLQHIAGDNMKRLLHLLSRNSIIGVIAGTWVTAVIQSSSATTVMVIGFINAGLLSLKQSIGIIFGSNIGTTVTAQIISFNIAGIALPAITIGFLLYLSKKKLLRGWGETVLGFGLLFFGMTMMSDELKMLGTFPSFYAAFQTFDCTPIDGFMPVTAILGAIAIGLVATVLIQSSSAAMGIVLALAAGGLINFYTAVPLLLGSNIGTTVTAFLASLTANRVAKQAALAHALFNVIGAIIMIGGFYIPYGNTGIPVFLYFINYITPGNVFAIIPHGIERHIAMAHTFFNVTVTIILLPFVSLIAKMCELILPVSSDKQLKITTLEPHLIATPALALDRAIQSLHNMVKNSWEIVDIAFNKHFISEEISPEAVQNLQERETKIEEKQSLTTEYLISISAGELNQSQSNVISTLLYCTNDAERIASHCGEIMKLTSHINLSSKHFSKDAIKDLKNIWRFIDQEANQVIAALQNGKSCDVKFLHQEVMRLKKKSDSAHFDRLRKGKCSASLGVIYIEMLEELEKLSILISNIAQRTSEIKAHHVKL